MAELPELETIRRELEKEAVGKRLKSPEVTGTKVIRRNGSKKAFQTRLEGAKIKGVERRGTHLAATLDNGEMLVISLGPTGRIEKATPRAPVPKGTSVVLGFTQGGQIRLIDPGGGSEAFVAAGDALADEAPELVRAGLDPVADAVSWTSFARTLLPRSGKLKALIQDPDVVAGIGPMYSDEILWEAGLRHDRTTDSLTSQEIRRLFRALVETLHEAVKHRGTTTDDHPFVDLYGKPGGYQSELKVFGREGEPCPRCRTPVSKSRFANKPVYHCDGCQI